MNLHERLQAVIKEKKLGRIVYNAAAGARYGTGKAYDKSGYKFCFAMFNGGCEYAIQGSGYGGYLLETEKQQTMGSRKEYFTQSLVKALHVQGNGFTLPPEITDYQQAVVVADLLFDAGYKYMTGEINRLQAAIEEGADFDINS